MKSILIKILPFIIGAFIGFTGGYINKVMERKDSVIQQQDSIIQQNAIYRDSIDAAFSKTRDSLDIAFTTIRQINAEKQQAIEYAQQVTKRYERIRFQKMKSDQERDSALHELYPTMK